MDHSSILGLLIGFGIISTAIITDSSIIQFISGTSLLIVLGGTLAAISFSFSFQELRASIKLVYKVFTGKRPDNVKTVEILVELAKKARIHGWLSLNENLHREKDKFFKKGLSLLLENAESDYMRDTLHLEIKAIRDRHRKGHRIFKQMAKYAPAFGIVGTLIGFIQMLNVTSDPSTIGPKMAIALLTTLYGVILSILVFRPIAYKLQSRTDDEILYKTIIMNGLLAINLRINPMQMEDRLKGFLSRSNQMRIEGQREMERKLKMVI